MLHLVRLVLRLLSLPRLSGQKLDRREMKDAAKIH